MVMVGPGGIVVERVLGKRHLRRPPRPMLRVRHGSHFVRDCRTIATVARLVDPATLEVWR